MSSSPLHSGIELSKVGKKYNYQWIFKNLSYSFLPAQSYAILGNNGSGKSTMLKVICGLLQPDNGSVDMYQNGQKIPEAQFYRHLHLITPELHLDDYFTLVELLKFHQSFKVLKKGIDLSAMIEEANLQHARNRILKDYSSGMKQKVKLLLAFCFEAAFICLDEPTAFLDTSGIAWYRKQIQKLLEDSNQCLIVASNTAHEYDFCTSSIKVSDCR